MRVWLGLLLVATSLGGCASTPGPFLGDLPWFELNSLAFAEGGSIPARYSCDGDGHSIPLSWRLAPAEATHFALIFEDPEADYVHWIWWDLPAFQQAIPSDANITLGGGAEGRASNGGVGYAPLCPPEGESHRYYATLYALDAPLELPEGAGLEALRNSLEDHAMARAVLSGVYR